MGIQAMVTSLKANSIRVKKPTYFESADPKRLTFRRIKKRNASPKELEAVKTKIKRQNRIENMIYGIVVLGAVLLTWNIFN